MAGGHDAGFAFERIAQYLDTVAGLSGEARPREGSPGRGDDPIGGVGERGMAGFHGLVLRSIERGGISGSGTMR